MGAHILDHLINEFIQEFPILNELLYFLEERGYQSIKFDEIWDVNEI